MKNKILFIVIMTTILANGWAIQTHRAIDRAGYKKASNIDTFMKDSGLDIKEAYGRGDDREVAFLSGFSNVTYFEMIDDGEEPHIDMAMEEMKQKFQKYNYEDVIEAGAILEDALYNILSTNFGVEGNGRYLHHFLDPQDGNKGLFRNGIYNLGIFDNALVWSKKESNFYSYPKAREFYRDAFTLVTAKQRRRARAQMFVAICKNEF